MARSPRARTPRRKAGAAAPSLRPATPIGPPIRPDTAGDIFTSPPVDIGFAGPEHRLARADLEIQGIYHGEASYEGRIFLNNPKADATTPKTIASGYAGSFNIFGHGGCIGDPGHCEINESNRDPFDVRSPHPLTPAKKRISVTAALKEIAKTTDRATVTIVPVVTAANALCDTKNVFRCEGLKFVSYNG